MFKLTVNKYNIVSFTICEPYVLLDGNTVYSDTANTRTYLNYV